MFNYFTTENTPGYGTSDIAELNRRLNDAYEHNVHVKLLAAKVIAIYDADVARDAEHHAESIECDRDESEPTR